MKTLLIGTLAVALAAVIIISTPSPVLAQQGSPAYNCTSIGQCWIAPSPPTKVCNQSGDCSTFYVLQKTGCAWFPNPTGSTNAYQGTCSCPPGTNVVNNYCSQYSAN